MSFLIRKSFVNAPARSVRGFACARWPMARMRNVTICPRTRSAGMTMLYRPCAFVATERFNSVMNAFAFSRTWPVSDVTKPVNVAACACSVGARSTDSAIAATTKTSARETYRRLMFTSDRWDSPWGRGYAPPFPVVMNGLLRASNRNDDGTLASGSQGLAKKISRRDEWADSRVTGFQTALIFAWDDSF